MSEDNTEHAHLSPSGSKRWMSCAGSLTLERDFPNTSNTYSDDGTAMHTIASRVLTTPGTAAEQYEHELVPVHKKTEPPRYVRFTAEMAELVSGYVNSLRAIAAGEPIMVEQRVDFSEFVQVPGQFGTLDAGILFLMEGELFVGDLKTGHTPVEVEANSQLMLYALGLLRKLLDNDLVTAIAEPFAYARALGIAKVRLGIYQPKTTGGWTEWSCSLDDLEAFAALARSKAMSTVNAERDYQYTQAEEGMTISAWERTYLNQNPNDKDCAFCRAMAVCPSVRRKVEETVGADFQVVAPTPVTAADLLAQAMTAAPLVEDWITAVRAETERRLLAGQEVPGFGLELGRKGARKFKDEVAAEQLLRSKWRYTYEDVYEMKLKTPTALEKLTKPTKAIVDGKEVVAKPVLGPRRWDTLVEMIEQAPPKPSVKPLSQIKTPYVVPAPSADDFSSVKE